MEALSLLKYWRTSGGSAAARTTAGVSTAKPRTATKTIVAAVSPCSSDGGEGPYFDLEFDLPDQETEEEESSTETQKADRKAQNLENEVESDSEDTSENDEDDDEGELKFALAGGTDFTDRNVTLSPSDELFFKGNSVFVEPSSILLNGSEVSSKIPAALLKSATKFRVLLLKLKKSKSDDGVHLENAEQKTEEDEVGEQASIAEEKARQGKVNSKFFAVKFFKVEEVPLVSLFTRDNSSKQNHEKALKQQDSESTAASDERKLAKEVVQKYLKMVKPLYVRVSKRYVEKLRFSGQLSFPGRGSKGCTAATPPSDTEAEKKGERPVEPAPSDVKTTRPKQGKNLQARLEVVRKHLGKSRSASGAVSAAPPGKVASNGRDDSLVQLQDGIQGAILHCKKSFNTSKDSDSSSSPSTSELCRSVSDPSYGKPVTMQKISSHLGEAEETTVTED